MSRNNQKPSSKLEDVLVPRQFELRLWDTWEAPSLILLLDGKDQRILRETFDIHWKDLDIHIRLIDECCGTGVAREQRVRRDKNVKVVYELITVLHLMGDYAAASVMRFLGTSSSWGDSVGLMARWSDSWLM